jgi:hypothetical protein
MPNTTTARESLTSALRAIRKTDGTRTYPDTVITAALDNYRDRVRAETLAEAKTETIAWLLKKAGEYRSTRGKQHAFTAEAIEVLASKLDRGAVRAFLGTQRFRDAMDAHRAKVLREAADAVVQAFVSGVTPARSERDEVWDQAALAIAEELRRMADEAVTQ